MGVITNLDTLIDDTVATRLDELDATVTTLSFDTDTDTLSYVDEEGTTTDVDLSKYIDDTNLARITSASLDSETGEVTFTRDDDSTFTLDLSNLFVPVDGGTDGTDGTDGLMTDSDKFKLDGIESEAEVNVQSDWTTTDTDDDSYIKNKPFVAAQVQTATSDVIYDDSETDKNYRLRVINGDIALEEL